MDKLGVCNLALQLIGVSDRIEREDEDSLERQVCFDWYDIARERMLTAFPWNFARATETDVECVHNPNQRFPYHVVLPKSCLFVRGVYIEDNMLRSGIRAYMSGVETEGMPRPQDSIYKMEPVTSWLVSDNAIFALEPISGFDYTLNRKDVDKFPAGKIQLLAYFLAESIAPALQRNSDITVRMAQLRQSYLQTNINEDVAQLRDWAS